jgi:hypothetical protein
MEKKNKVGKKRKVILKKREGKLEKKWKNAKKKKTLWITVVIHSNLGVREQWFPHTI